MGIYVNPPSPPFGKSMAADMLTAYYSRGCNSAALFEGRKAKTGEAFQEHLNRHHVIRLDIQKFLETTGRIFWFYRRRGQRIVCSEKNGFKEIIQEYLRAVKVGGWEGHEKGKETERSDKELWRNYM